MNCFTAPLAELSEFNKATDIVAKKKGPLLVTGLGEALKANFAMGLAEGISTKNAVNIKNKVFVTYSEQRARELLDDLRLYDRNAMLYPAKDAMFFAADVHGSAIVSERISVMKKIFEGEPSTIVLTLDAGLLKVLPVSDVIDNIIQLKTGATIELDKLCARFVSIGYTKVVQVTDRGQFAVRGEIIDIYPLTEDSAVRVEMWGDDIDNIRFFDAESQRTIDDVERPSEITIYPAAEMVLDESHLEKGRKRIEKEAARQVETLRKQMKTEQAARIRDASAEFLESLDTGTARLATDSYINYFYDNTESFFDYFGDDTIFYLDEPLRLTEMAKAVKTEFSESMSARLEGGYILPGQADLLWDPKKIFALLSGKHTVMLSLIEAKTGDITAEERVDVTARNVNPYNNDFPLLVKDIKSYKKSKSRVILVSPNSLRSERLAKELTDNGINAVYASDFTRIPEKSETVCVTGNLRRGFEYPLIGFVVISESDIFGGLKKKKRRSVKKSDTDTTSIASFSELHVGDYVIHENHGLGIYKGIEKIERDGVTRDYLKIEYQGGSALFVPASGLDLISKYAGAGSRKPHVNELGGTEWRKTKSKVRTSVDEIAKDLVELYARRQNAKGYAFSPDTVWQKEFEETFPYEETDDQLNAIADVKRDMESTKIMDRLICGDVGFGKTEIAIRAAFKAVMDGKQVALLVPTTILAEQHYNTFAQRMREFPVTVEILSRFRTPKETKQVKEGLKAGNVDIVIGTHKLLGKDIEYKNLGLLIVDEEQRFGVTHKEKIKKLRENIDVLTLSATPIPRTLHMSLAGIRDMSVLEEAPVDRLPIQTYVLEHNDEIIREAINREIARNGQVYYVYNRVKGIEDAAARVAKLVPDANVAFAHGQMSQHELERIMFDFINGDIDVLISTTIIETGIDIANVNTIIIDDADRMGLSQLYQLRGRVGRSSRTAFAFMMYKRDKVLREVAEKRLAAIKEFTDLGSGFKIAMRDLEIRGAGNLLGKSQSGHMETVGYDLYCKMLNDAVRKLKGENVISLDFETVMNLDVNAFIPAAYIKNEVQKLEAYKRIAAVTSEEELMDIEDELMDRYGEIPASVDNLVNVSYLRFIAHQSFITDVVLTGGLATITMYAKAQVDTSKIPPMLASYGGRLKIKSEGAEDVKFTYRLTEEGNGRLRELRKLLLSFHELLPDGTKKEAG